MSFVHTIFSVIFMVLEKRLISLYGTNRLVFITENNRVYCAVRTGTTARFIFFITVYHQEQSIKNFAVIFLSSLSVVFVQ
jgi:hypothetical protein